MKRLSSAEAQVEIARIVGALKGYEPEKIILFGSFARGDYHAGSDVDLIVIKETERPFADRIGDALQFCRSRIPVEPRVYRPSEITAMLARGNGFLETALKD